MTRKTLVIGKRTGSFSRQNVMQTISRNEKLKRSYVQSISENNHWAFINQSDGCPWLTDSPTSAMPRTDKWGLTQVKIKKCTYTWTISNFSYLRKRIGEELESPAFSMDNDENPKWCMKLYPSGINENFKDYVSLYLLRKSGTEYKLDGRYSLSVLNSKKEKFLEDSEECQYNKNYSSWGFPAFIKIDVLGDESNGLLDKDALTLFCDLSVVVDVVNVSSDNAKAQYEFPIERANDTLEKLFLDEKFSDVRLMTQCGKEIRAHKSILAAKSPIFSAMFEHDMIERKLSLVEIKDVEYDALKEMLRFVYAGRVENIQNIACGLLAAADKYGIEGLKDICEDVLTDMITVENVIEILVISDRHNIDLLKTRTINFVKAHIGEVLNSVEFKSLGQVNILKDIITAMTLH